jgi:hypothetical protein
MRAAWKVERFTKPMKRFETIFLALNNAIKIHVNSYDSTRLFNGDDR